MIQIEPIEGVYKFRMARTLLGRGLYFTTAYWVDGLLIDTGCAHTLQEFFRSLEGLPVNLIVNTHSHEDHIAANALLKSRYRVEPLAHPLALPVMASPGKMQPLQLYRKVMWGLPEPCRGLPLEDQVRTEHHTFQVIHTPGHSPDHICLYEPHKGWLFTGDAYVGGKERALRMDYDIWGIIASLKKLLSLRIELLFPGSGSIRKDPLEEIKAKITYLEDLGERILKLNRQGMSLWNIRKRVLGLEMPIAYYTLGHFSGYGL
ncbi:MAG: hypothetical protein C0407_12720, partial [Desulfobacca sp.]|nr:hypothetical protein [Desulfobacca sp.]